MPWPPRAAGRWSRRWTRWPATASRPRPQPEDGVTYAAKLSKAEAELDFHEAAEALAARIRAFNPWPVAWCALGDDRLRLLMAEAHPTPGQRERRTRHPAAPR